MSSPKSDSSHLDNTGRKLEDVEPLNIPRELIETAYSAVATLLSLCLKSILLVFGVRIHSGGGGGGGGGGAVTGVGGVGESRGSWHKNRRVTTSFRIGMLEYRRTVDIIHNGEFSLGGAAGGEGGIGGAGAGAGIGAEATAGLLEDEVPVKISEGLGKEREEDDSAEKLSKASEQETT